MRKQATLIHILKGIAQQPRVPILDTTSGCQSVIPIAYSNPNTTAAYGLQKHRRERELARTTG